MQPGDGERYRGRGYIQLTGRANYRAAGDALGLPLEVQPDLALQPEVAAKVLVWYLKSRGVADAARAGAWQRARILVNGGLNGWQRFAGCVNALMALPEPPAAPALPTPRPVLVMVLRETELRADPKLEDVELPIDRVRAGTLVLALGGVTPHWLQVQLPDRRRGWLYRPNLGPVAGTGRP